MSRGSPTCMPEERREAWPWTRPRPLPVVIMSWGWQVTACGGLSMGWPRADPAGASCAGPCAGHFHHLWRCRGGGPCHQRKPTIVQRSPWRPRWTSAPFAAVPRWTKRQARPVPGVEMPCTGRCQPVPFSALRTCAPAAGAGDAPEQEGVRWPDRPTSGAAPLWSGQGRWPRVRSTRASSSWKAGFLG